MNNHITRLLWVDDDLFGDLNELRIALYLLDDFETDFALNATEAFNLMRQHPYDIVIVDLRLPPGPHNYWQEQEGDGLRGYGHPLLRRVKGDNNELFKHLKDTCFAVYSIDPKEEMPTLFKPPVSLPDDCYCQKTEHANGDEFIEFINKLKGKCQR